MKKVNNNIKKSITISATLAAVLGVGVVSKPINKLNQYQTKSTTYSKEERADEPIETKGVYRNWQTYNNTLTEYSSAYKYHNYTAKMNYKLSTDADGGIKYEVGIVFPDIDATVEYGSGTRTFNTKQLVQDLVEGKTDGFKITMADLESIEEDGDFGTVPSGTIGVGSQYAPINIIVDDESYYRVPESEEDWPFELTAVDLYSTASTSPGDNPTTTFDPYQHLIFEIPLTDEKFDSLKEMENNSEHSTSVVWDGPNDDDGNGVKDHLYEWVGQAAFRYYVSEKMHVDSNFGVIGINLDGGTAGSDFNLWKHGDDDNWTRLNDRDDSLWLRYPEPTFEVLNADDVQEQHPGEMQINNGSFSEGYEINFEYDHSVTSSLFSVVNGIEYTLYGPTNKDDGTTDSLWDRWTVTDEGIEREYRISPDSPETTTEIIALNDGTSSSEWLDGENTIGQNNWGTWDGLDQEFDEQNGEGDLNIATVSPIQFTPTDPNSETATNYTTAWLHSGSEYKIEVNIDGEETAMGYNNSFVFPWNSSKPAFEGWLVTEEYVASEPVLESFAKTSQSDPHEDDGTITATYNYSLDTKSDEEFDGSLESPSYISKIELVDVSDDNKVYATQDITEDLFDEDGKYSSSITSNDLPANSELSMALRITYGKGSGEYTSNDLYPIYEDQAITTTTNSRGFADKEITSISQNGTTVTNSDTHTASTNVDIVVDDIFQIEDGYTSSTIPTQGEQDTNVLTHYDSSNINFINIVDDSTGVTYGSSNPTETNGTVTIAIDDLGVNKDTSVHAELGYYDDYGNETVISSDSLTISSDPVGAFPPEVQEFVIEQPVLNPDTRRYTLSGHAAIDISPTTDADGNGYTGEGDYSPSNVTSVEIWETSKTDAAVLVIDDSRIDNESTLWTAEDFTFTIGEDGTYEVPANSDLEFTLKVNYDGGKQTQSLSTQKVTTGTRGEIAVNGVNLDVDASKTESNPVGPEMKLNWALDYEDYGYDWDDFNPLSIDVMVYDEFDNEGGEHIDSKEVATAHYDDVVSGIIEFGGNDIDLNQTTTHDFTIKTKVTTIDETTYEFSAPETLHYEAGILVAGAYVPNIVGGINVTENDINIVDDAGDISSSRDGIDISFDSVISKNDDGVETGYKASGVKTIKVYAYTNNEADVIGDGTFVSGEENGLDYGYEIYEFDTSSIVDGTNHFEASFTDLYPNRNYTFNVVTTYSAYKLEEGTNSIVVDDSRNVDSVETFTTTTEAVGYEDINPAEDLGHLNIGRTATTATIQYSIDNASYGLDGDLQYLKNYDPSTVKVVDYNETTGDVKVLGSVEAGTNSITITDIPVGYNIAEGNLRFQIYTSHATYSNIEVENPESAVNDDSEFLAISEVIDTEWLESFPNTPPDVEGDIDDIITGTYESPVFGEMKVKTNSITQNSFNFEMDITDNSNLVDFSQGFTMTNDGQEFEVELVQTTRDGAEHITSGTGTYEFKVSGLKAGTTYGTDWTFGYSIYDLEADLNSTQYIDVVSDISIMTLEAPTSAGAVFLWILLILLLLTIIGGVLFLVWFFLLNGNYKVSETVETKKGSLSFRVNEDDKFNDLIKGRTLVGTQDGTEKELSFTKTGDVFKLTGITNTTNITKLTFKADSASNDDLAKKYEAELTKWETAKAKHEEKQAKLKEEGKETTKFEQEKPSKPKLEKDIVLGGKAIAIIPEEKPADVETKPAKEEGTPSKADAEKKEYLESLTKPKLVKVAATVYDESSVKSYTKPQLVDLIMDEKSITLAKIKKIAVTTKVTIVK